MIPRKLNRWILPGTVLLIAGGLILAGCTMQKNAAEKEAPTRKMAEDKKLPDGKKIDAIADKTKRSRDAFGKVYSVLMHARCMNCHPSGDQPLQGEDSHIHFQNVQRGVDGKGLFALKCSNCHQDQNVPGLHMPPGNPNWHLPAANMPLVFQGLSPRQLAIQLKDPAKNGNKSMEQLFHHISEDKLVLGGWNPGEGRQTPPLSHEQFVKEFKIWMDNGAEIPLDK